MAITTTMLCINHHIYADDTQIYMSLSVSNAKGCLEKMLHCLIGVSAWMTGSNIRLNPGKTEFIRIECKLQQKQILKFPMLNFRSKLKFICIRQQPWCMLERMMK